MQPDAGQIQCSRQNGFNIDENALIPIAIQIRRIHWKTRLAFRKRKPVWRIQMQNSISKQKPHAPRNGIATRPPLPYGGVDFRAVSSVGQSVTFTP